MEWQPIETAPKGEPVLIWAKEWNEWGMFVAKLCKHDGTWDLQGATGYEWESSFDTPTHWMPLPVPPK
jgi:hypothetical protein